MMRLDPPTQVGFAMRDGRDPAQLGLHRADYDADAADWRAFATELAGKYGAEIVDPAAMLCDADLCRLYDKEAGVLYFNSEHLGVKGAAYTFKGLAEKLR